MSNATKIHFTTAAFGSQFCIEIPEDAGFFGIVHLGLMMNLHKLEINELPTDEAGIDIIKEQLSLTIYQCNLGIGGISSLLSNASAHSTVDSHDIMSATSVVEQLSQLSSETSQLLEYINKVQLQKLSE